MDKSETETICAEHEAGRKRDRWQVPKDHGYSWIVLLGAFFEFFLVMGGYRAFGVLFVELKYQFPDKTEEELTSVLTLACLLGFSLSPIVTGLTTRVSCRTLSMVGGITGCLQYLLSAFAPNFTFLLFSFSIFAGLTVPLAYATPLIHVGQYFEKRRAMANGMAMAGASIGNFVFPILFRLLFENMGFRNGMIIIGGIMLNGCWCGALLRPVSFYRKPDKFTQKQTKNNKIYIPLNNTQQDGKMYTCNEMRSKSLEVLANSSESSIRPRADTVSGADPLDKQRRRTRLDNIQINELEYVSSVSIAEGMDSEQRDSRVESNDKKNTCLNALKNFWYLPTPTGVRRPLIDFSLLLNPAFATFCLAVFCTSSSYIILMLSVIAHIDDLGYTKDQGAITVSFMGVGDLIGRVFLLSVLELKPFRKYKMYAFSVYMTIAGVFALVIAFTDSYVVITIMASCFRGFCGTMYPLIPVLLVETLGIEKLPSSYGLVLFSQAASAFMCTAAGKLRNSTGNWLVSFYMVFAFLLTGAAIAAMLPLVKKCCSNDTPKQQQPAESVPLQEGADTTQEA